MYLHHEAWLNLPALSIAARSASVDDWQSRVSRTRRTARGRIQRHGPHRSLDPLCRAAIEAKERAFRSDGRLSGREFAELNRYLDRLALNVREQRHDQERRY